MKTKEEIENLKDIRRNLWISIIGIIGAISAYTMSIESISFFNNFIM